MANDLTPEELEELKQLDAEVLSSEEQAELAALDQEIAGMASEKDIQEKAAVDAIAQDPEATSLESASAGFIQGIPFMKDAIAGYDAISEAITNDTEESIGDVWSNYKMNLQEMNEDIERASQDNPWAATAGDIVGSLSTLPASGLKGAMAVGALSGLSRSEERTVASALTGAVSGAVFHGIGVLGAKAIRKGLKGARNLASGTTKEAVGGVSRPAVKAINRHLKKTGQTADEFSESLFKQRVKMPDGEEALFKIGQEFEETFEKVGRAKKKVGKEMGEVLAKVKDVTVEPELIHSRVRRAVIDPLMESDSSAKQALGEKILKMLDNDILKISKQTLEESSEKGIKNVADKAYSKPWSLRRLHTLKSDIADDVYKTAQSTEEGVLRANTQKRAVITEMNKMIDDLILSSTDDTVLKSWKSVKKDYGNLAIAEETLEKHIESQGHGIMGNIKDLFAVRGVVVGGLSASLGIGGIPALAIGAGLNRLTTSGAMPATMAIGMRRLADVITKNPTGEVAKRLITASSLPMLEFRKELAGQLGEVQLKDSPLKRDTASVIQKKESIQAILDANEPDMAAVFSSAVESEDPEAIGAIMAQLSNDPRFAPFVEEGIGWNGKVYSEEDRAILEEQLKGNNEISLAQRLRHLESLRQQGIIPQVQPDPKPPLQHIPRRKDRHEY